MPFNHRDFWSTTHVKAQLQSGPMPDGKTFLYFLAITAFDWLQFTMFRLAQRSEPISTWERFDAWIAVAITIAGLVYLFLCNGGWHGQHFLYRYFPLAVVVGWKIVAVSIIAIAAMQASLTGTSPAFIGWSTSAALVAVNLVMFLRIGHHLTTLRRATGVNSTRRPVHSN
jgi:hypothetical protein